MRTITNKTEFIKKVRFLKSLKRNYDTVNQRCQNELSNAGFHFFEQYESLGEDITEHGIYIINSDNSRYDYGTLLVYGMNTLPKSLTKQLYRYFAISIDIPDFYKPEVAKTKEEFEAENIDLNKEKEFLTEDPFFINDNIPETSKKASKPKKSKNIIKWFNNK